MANYKTTVPEGGARHAIPSWGVLTVQEGMPDEVVEAFLDAGVTQYFEKVVEQPVNLNQNGTESPNS